jgi:hypothetical protein
MKKGDLFQCESPYSVIAPRKTHRIQYTGEFRKPKKGEWFISGALPEGYQAYKDLNQPYHIGKLVKLKIQTIVNVEDV